MGNPSIFYTYAYLREDRTPYYIGKGKGRRLYSKDKKEVRLPKDKSRIIFLKQNLTEEDAFGHEIYMISIFGRVDLGTGILRNKTDGGEGLSGRIVSEETKRKQSKAKKGKNIGNMWWNDGNGNTKFTKECPGKGWVLGVGEEIRRKLSELNGGENNPNYGKKGENNPNYGKKWWNDGEGNNTLSIECPGEGWVIGRYENQKIKTKRIEMWKGKNNPNFGKRGAKWWNDNEGNTKISVECPGQGWVLGRGTKRKQVV